jgi:hypothetical protein
LHLEIQKAHNLKGSPLTNPKGKKSKNPYKIHYTNPRQSGTHTLAQIHFTESVYCFHMSLLSDFLEMQLIVYSKAILLSTPKELCDSFVSFEGKEKNLVEWDPSTSSSCSGIYITWETASA